MWKTKSKYKNKKTARGFHSKKEEARNDELELMQKAGLISNLETQRAFAFEHNGVKICKYLADFCYLQDGKQVVEDVKSPFTRKLPVYRMKYKMMLAFYGIKILET